MAENPHGWNSGPPKSEIELWHHQKRIELMNVTLELLRGSHAEPFTVSQDEIESRVEIAIETAKVLIRKTEEAHPRL